MWKNLKERVHQKADNANCIKRQQPGKTTTSSTTTLALLRLRHWGCSRRVWMHWTAGSSFFKYLEKLNFKNSKNLSARDVALPLRDEHFDNPAVHQIFFRREMSRALGQKHLGKEAQNIGKWPHQPNKSSISAIAENF